MSKEKTRERNNGGKELRDEATAAIVQRVNIWGIMGRSPGDFFAPTGLYITSLG
ncbi:hypothetical protein VU10_07310 [Desulfobulbus sp. US1]|nr:hypothetical protein [Desulfobulbus sp. US1]